MELEVPFQQRSDVSLVLSDVVHADRAVFPDDRRPVPAKSGSCILDYALPRAEDISLALYDVLGRQMRTVVRGETSAGRYEHAVDLSELSSGLYVLHLHAGGPSGRKS